MSFAQELTDYFRAGYPALYVVAQEEARCLSEVQHIAATLTQRCAAWTITEGWAIWDGNTVIQRNKQQVDPLAALQAVQSMSVSFCCLVNFDFYLSAPEIVQKVKDLLQPCKSGGKLIVFVSNILKIPQQLEKDLTVLEFSLPDKDELGRTLDTIADSGQVKAPKGDFREQCLDAALGMTSAEAENAFALCLVKKKEFVPAIIMEEKRQVIRKGGILEFYPVKQGLEAVGGLNTLKTWLQKRLKAFSPEARKYGLLPPKGVLIVGVPGCGKSLTAKAVAHTWGVPLLRFDVGKVFGSLVGQSEEQCRKAISLAEAVAPCVLHIDEIEKALSGVESSGETSSGVVTRVFSTLLTWLSDKTSMVFVAATANAVDKLPPELLRKGRFDEIFYVDLPTPEERNEIILIHLKARSRDAKKFKVDELVRESDGFSGAEIEQAIIAAMYDAFDVGREVTTSDIINALRSTTPLKITMAEKIEVVREWAKNRARPATEIQQVEQHGKRKVRV